MPVIFVGAGPGDPNLLTIAATQILELADVILHDELIPEEMLKLIPNAEPYRGIDQLVAEAREGKRVVRLQIGDPTIYGRLVEQMEALDAAGIEYDIIPGVTSATAAAAAAKVSLTHKTLGRTVALVSAHDDSIPVPDADTVVFYMGRPQRPGPVIAIERASQEEERILRNVEEAKAPSIVISGAVADLNSLPLYRKRVVVTRAESSKLDAKLRALGAEVIPFPVIQIVDPSDSAPLDEAVKNLSSYDWLIFTSANGVRSFFDRVSDLRTLRARICTIGPATQAEVEKHKLLVDVVPEEYVAEGLVSSLPGDLSGQRILIPHAAVARDVVPDELRKRGAIVDVVEAYRTIVPAALKPVPDQADWITFTSSSTVTHYLQLAGRPTAKIASIGPITSGTLRANGLEPDVEAEEYTVDGLVDAIRRRTVSNPD